MIDIHTHILPGFDDGAEDEMMAWRTVMRSVSEESVCAIFVTPHSDAFDLNPAPFPDLLHRLRNTFPHIAFYPGCEILCEPAQMEQILENLKTGLYPSMNGSRYVLVEFHSGAEAQQIHFCLSALIHNGWKPILAHPERCRNLHDEIDLIREQGVLLQVNTCSLSQWDEDDLRIREKARQLVSEEKVTFLGTDTHGLIRRPPVVSRAMDYLTTACTPEYLAAITCGNAERLLIRKES